MATVIVTGYGNVLKDKDLSTPGFATEHKGTTHSQELLVARKKGAEPGDDRETLFWQCSGKKKPEFRAPPGVIVK